MQRLVTDIPLREEPFGGNRVKVVGITVSVQQQSRPDSSHTRGGRCEPKHRVGLRILFD